MFKIDQLKKTLARLHFPDKALLRGTKLAPLAKSYDAYPVMQDGRRLCVLVSSGISPQEASRLMDAQARSKIVVLQEEIGQWVKVWPTADADTETAAKANAEPAPAPAEGELIEE